MTVKEARTVLSKPVFGSDWCIHARDVLILSEQVKKARRDCELHFGEPVFEVAPALIGMDEKELRSEMENFRNRGYGSDWP
jgi:hypothetical protein